MREIHRILRASGYAIEGLRYLLKEQKNTRLLLIVSVLSLIICPLLGFSAMQTAIVFFSTVLASVAEILNTAVEITLDLEVKGEYHPSVKIAKDVAAASVFISVINAVVIFVIFLIANLL